MTSRLFYAFDRIELANLGALFTTSAEIRIDLHLKCALADFLSTGHRRTAHFKASTASLAFIGIDFA
jgi:hypothetical protein